MCYSDGKAAWKIIARYVDVGCGGRLNVYRVHSQTYANSNFRHCEYGLILQSTDTFWFPETGLVKTTTAPAEGRVV